MLQGCSVLGGFVSFKILDPSLVALLRGTFSVWVLLMVEPCMAFSPRKL